jgi:clindamycin resistance transfer factor btgB
MKKGFYTEGFFNLAEDNIYKSKIIKDIDSNIGQLLKTDAKFYAIHVSPSEKELRTMGNTEQEQAESMKQYIRKVFISEYAKNFNKELSALDIKFYGKIHFDRSRSDNELNMHCHLIVSRKDQTNKKKLSPLTNHKNTANGIIKGGFNRMNLFQQVEQGFDKLFSYNRQLSQSFEYSNTMKNGSIDDKLKMQEQKLKEPKQYFTAEKKKEIFQSNEKENIISCDLDSKADNKQSYNQQNNSGGDSLLFILSLRDGNNYDATSAEELQTQKHKKKKKKRIRR